MKPSPRSFLYHSAELVLVTLLLACQTVSAQDALLESHIKLVMAEAKIPSVAIAGIKGGRIVQVAAFGEHPERVGFGLGWEILDFGGISFSCPLPSVSACAGYSGPTI